MTVKTYIVEVLQKHTIKVRSASDIKLAGEACKRELPKGTVMLSITEQKDEAEAVLQ